ncbi:MAG: Asp-tRNA(Asn)/Glu-tRNA(Gln) amidotransferase subunit GatB [Clostridia bacterium]|nr:Asp-tRNA(Asn)/Glu-tRNA(Gln) amidotransferase subunit GatB [Clostridia bacterium]
MKLIKDYELVCGLEVHVELATSTKIFCSCPTTFGAEPNTQCCPVCTGMPGALPVLNRQVVDYAVMAGLATNCRIAGYSKQDRKNYFYPDLPKAYQISQYDLPLCEGGYLEIETEEGKKRIGITRIHIEEDAGKLIHDVRYGTMIDCNRCGVPLIEIVSEPDIRSAEEAVAYVKKLRAVIMYTGVSDCRMNEGSLRCDVNLSVRKKGSEKFGTRTEMKNINSFTFIREAIEYEYKRQVEILEAGGAVVQETRRYDSETGETYSMRTKENANDYRYFPDPDLPPVILTDKEVDALGKAIPRLPDERKAYYTEKYGLSEYDAELLTENKRAADYFESVAEATDYPKLAANMMISELFALLPPDLDEVSIPIEPIHIAALATMAGEGTINSSVAKKLLRRIYETDSDPVKMVEQEGLAQINDAVLLKKYVDEAVAADTKSVTAYKAGNTKAAKAIMGKVMAMTGGRGNPAVINELLEAALLKL